MKNRVFSLINAPRNRAAGYPYRSGMLRAAGVESVGRWPYAGDKQAVLPEFREKYLLDALRQELPGGQGHGVPEGDHLYSGKRIRGFP